MIGGQLDWTTLAAADPATAHAPRDRREYIAAARDLAGRGLTPDDIASALKLTRLGVIELLRGKP